MVCLVKEGLRKLFFESSLYTENKYRSASQFRLKEKKCNH